jgi:hypothetical protein
MPELLRNVGDGRGQAASRLLKNAETSSFRGAGSAREPGNQEHGPEKSIAWPVFMGSRPGPDGPSRNDARVFQHPASIKIPKYQYVGFDFLILRRDVVGGGA